MTFLSGQDDFFQTADQPISARHLSQPYNKYIYVIWLRKMMHADCLISGLEKVILPAQESHFAL